MATRTSASSDQALSLQLNALAKAGCEMPLTETASGATADQPVPTYLRAGDTLVVQLLDRLGGLPPQVSSHHAEITDEAVKRRVRHTACSYTLMSR